MSIGRKAFYGASWLALFKSISQIFSWAITIIIARILDPKDYGLMEMATFVTGYALIFNELGLGKAIIQRSRINNRQLSSVFWFSLSFSICLSILCIFLAYPTANYFSEKRIIPIAQLMSVIFITSGLQIVPLNLLKRNLQFKIVGIIELCGVIISSIIMFIIANLGGGVWTLVIGFIIKSCVRVTFTYSIVKWLPDFTFNFSEVRSILKFGLIVSFTKSLSYVNEKADRFLIARVWPANILGFYTLALQLSQIPTEKIVVLINQVSFSAFSQLKDNKDEFNKFYLNIIKITSTIVFPLFVGGFLLGEELITVLLNEKWLPIIFLFKYLCLSQIMTAINSVNSVVHTAQGRPQWHLWFNVVRAVVMTISFYIAIKYGLNAIIIPWFTTYFVLCFSWIIITLRKIDISLLIYIKTLFHQFFATIFMSFIVINTKFLINIEFAPSPIYSLIFLVLSGAISYFTYIWCFDRKIFLELLKLKTRKRF